VRSLRDNSALHSVRRNGVETNPEHEAGRVDDLDFLTDPHPKRASEVASIGTRYGDAPAGPLSKK
jgi:hypothetical protein